MPFINRYSTTTNGAITFTGNTLGLGKQNNANAPGTARSIGTFATVNTSLQDGTCPLGTTSGYGPNSSSAILVLPSRSTVLYAELIWGGSYNLGGENVSSVLDYTVSLTNSAGVFTVTPDTAAPGMNTSQYFYVRSANVTSLVQAGGGGTYTVGKVPGTQGDSENSTNHAGWTLAVIYQNATLPSRNMTIFVGDEMTDTPSSTNSVVVSGFFSPTSGPLSGRLLVSAQEGDSPLTGDQMQFGPTAADLAPVYGSNNPVSNFFCSQINNDSGLQDTTGTFGDRNHPTGSVISGGRQGWDITNVDVSSKLIHSQTSANIRGTTYGDVYLINALAFQVNINAPAISVTKESNQTTAYINEAITYKVTISNSGNATANTLTLTDQQPAGTTFIAGSVTVNGTAQASANPYTGISLGNLASSESIVVQFQSRVTSRPASPAQFADEATVTYQFQSVTGGTVFNGTAASSVVTAAAGNYPPFASDVTGTIAEDTSFTGQIPASDPESAVLSYTVASPPAHGTATLNANGSFTYVPNLNFNGTDSFSVTVSDGSGGTANSLVTIRVTPVNDPPAVQNLSFTTLEDTSLSGKVTATDVAGDSLTFSLAVPPAHGTVVFGPTGVFTYTPSPNYNGTDGFTYSISDGNGGAATASVTITVTPVNDPPVTSNLNLTTAEDTPVTGAVPATDVGGDSLTYTLAAPVTNGSVTLNADGTFVYAPGLHFNGTDSFAVRVSDGKGGTAVSNVTITVTPVNDPPIASGGSVVTPEDTPVSGKINASDADGDALTYALGTAPLNGTVVLAADGSYTYTPLANFNGTDSFNVVVSDGNGGAAISHVVVTVTPVNDLPAAQDKNVVTPEDTPVSGRVLASDVDGDALTFAPGAPSANGTSVVAPDGSYTYTAAPDFNGTDSFTVTVSDGNGGTDSAAATVTVTPVNDPPDMFDEQCLTPEDKPLTCQIKASDVAGDALTYALGTPPVSGTAVVTADGTYTYTPNPDFYGGDGFTVTVSDGNGGTATETVTVNVAPVNDAPVTADLVLTTPEDTAAAGQIAATDADGDALTFMLRTQPTRGSVILNPDGTFKYTPIPDFNGTDLFTVLVDDGNGGTAVANVTVTVTPVNDAPVAADQTDYTAEGTPVSGQIAASDAAGDALSFTLGTPPVNGSVVIGTDGAYSYTPNADFNGTDSFTVTGSDGAGGTDSAVVTVPVVPVNDAPILGTVNETTAEDTVLNGQITADDPEGDPGTIRVSDDRGAGFVSDVTVTVLPVNDPPRVRNVSQSTFVNQTVSGSIDADDIDNDVLTYSLDTPPANGTATAGPGNTYTYVPNPTFTGTDSFQVRVTDESGASATAAITVEVSPVFTGSSIETTLMTLQNTPLTSIVPLVPEVSAVYRLSTPPSNGSVSVNADGSFTYVPNQNFTGSDSFVLTESGTLQTVLVKVVVLPANQAPLVGNVQSSTTRNAPVSGTITATDPEGQSLFYNLNTLPLNGTASVRTDGTFTYTPSRNFAGTDSFTVGVTDAGGAVSIALITVNTVFANLPPVAENASYSTPEDTAVYGKLSAADPDSDLIAFTVKKPPAHGTAELELDGSFRYTPYSGFAGNDVFEVEVTDSYGAFSVLEVTVTILPVTEQPVAGNVELATREGEPVTGRIPAADPEGGQLLFELQGSPSYGTVVIYPDGTFTYTPFAGFTGTDVFTVAVTSLRTGEKTLAAVRITVNPSKALPPFNRPPAVSGQEFATYADTPLDGQIQAADPDDDPLRFELLLPPESGKVSVAAEGGFIYLPDTGFTGSDRFTVLIRDSRGGVSVALIVITVER
ncbi:Ig-like domain-containing protein [Paenibacillus sp. RC84]|uniref:tandem-95 repeat protein n=1 Tax=Paenibacillus sp. RC84 TaxID=3156252 RepID=UPI003516924E